MPIYEFECRSCGETFEEFVFRAKDAEKVSCPKCKKEQAKRVLSATSSFGLGAGGGCGPSTGGRSFG